MGILPNKELPCRATFRARSRSSLPPSSYVPAGATARAIRGWVRAATAAPQDRAARQLRAARPEPEARTGPAVLRAAAPVRRARPAARAGRADRRWAAAAVAAGARAPSRRRA